MKTKELNSIVHRDYFETGFGVSVEIFDDRVEIANFGKLLFDRKKLGKISFPRNPILFDLFHRLDMVEKAGSGIGRMKGFMKERKLKLKFIIDDVFFRITFHRILEKGVENLSDNEIIILNLIRKNPVISKKEMMVQGDLTKKTIEYNVEKLKGKSILKRIGPDKGGYWEIINNKNENEK